MTGNASRPWEIRAQGLWLHIHLTPKSGRDAIEGVALNADGKSVLKARVRAVPEDGRANSALIELLAKSLRMPKSAFTLETGGKSRVKTVSIDGDAASLAQALKVLTEKS